MVVISVSLSGQELAAFDDLVEHMNYDSRSSAIRDALYSFITEHRLDFQGETALVLTLVYAADTGQHEVQQVLHDEGELVQTALHHHVGDRCVDLLVLSGPGARVHNVLDRITSVKDVRVNATPL